ncbi:hypothetical protein AAHE18_04G089000 [Arachis hypogaea]
MLHCSHIMPLFLLFLLVRYHCVQRFDMLHCSHIMSLFLQLCFLVSTHIAISSSSLAFLSQVLLFVLHYSIPNKDVASVRSVFK